MPDEKLPELSITNNVITSFIAGGVAGALAKSTIAPLDRAKISFQVSSSRLFSFRAVIRYLLDTIKRDGILTLWRGNSATMARIVPYAATQFCAHEQWKRLLEVESPDVNHAHIRRYLSGSLAGVTSVTATYPLDMARARLAVSSKHQYRTLRSVFRKIYKTEGLLAFYRGFLPTVLGVIPYAGTSFFTYESLKQLHKRRFGEGRKIGAVERMMFGAIAGLTGQTASYPLDIVRRRMQTGAAPKNASIFLVLRSVAVDEGFIKGLYKGLSLNWIKGPIAVGISFTTFDTMLSFLRHLPYFQQIAASDPG